METFITKTSSVQTNKGPEQYFTGEVAVQLLHSKQGNSKLSAGLVRFQPGARAAWHTHPYGQLLIIVEGKGLVQQWAGPVREVAAGDIVWFPAEVKHWHGAAPDSAMSHYAIQEEKDGSAAEWMEKVSDRQYPGK